MSSLPLPNAFIRAAWFMENYQWDVVAAREQGEIDVYLNPVDRAFPMVATEDIGRLAAETLQQSWHGNRYLELEGPARYSPVDAANAFARWLKRPVSTRLVPRADWVNQFEQQGMPAGRTAPRIEMVDGFNSGWIDFAKNGTESFRGNSTLEETLGKLVAGK